MLEMLNMQIAFVLIFLISVASSNSENDNFLNQNNLTCPEIDTCRCITLFHFYEIQCPNESSPKLVLRVKPKHYLEIDCLQYDENIYDLVPKKMIVGVVPLFEIFNCPTPKNKSFSVILDVIGAANITTFKVQNSKMSLGFKIQRQHFKGFNNLERFVLNNRDFIDFQADLFTDLTNLKRFDFKSENITLPADIFTPLKNLEVLKIDYKGILKLSTINFKFQKHLKIFTMQGNKIESDLNHNVTVVLKDSLPSSFLSNIPQLDVVFIKSKIVNLPEDTFLGSCNISKISLAMNLMVELPINLLKNQKKLKELDLSHNMIAELDDYFLSGLRSLKVLKLSYNELTEINDMLFIDLFSLQEIYLDHNRIYRLHQKAFFYTRGIAKIFLEENKLTYVEAKTPQNSPFKSLGILSELNLQHNNIDHIFPDLQQLGSLQKLDLSHNIISRISIVDFDFTSSILTLNLSNNGINEVDFQMMQSIDFSKKDISVSLDHNPFNCNCKIKHFVEFLKRNNNFKTIQIPAKKELKCKLPKISERKPLTHLKSEDLHCSTDYFKNNSIYCPKVCVCDRKPGRVLSINCSNRDLKSIPLLPKAREHFFAHIELNIENNKITQLPPQENRGFADVNKFYAANNSIFSLDVSRLPKNLEVLDISNNHLETVDDKVVKYMESSESINQLIFSGNPWKCNCDNPKFLHFIQSTSHKNITDYKTMMCNGQRFNDITIEQLCSKNLHFWSLIGMSIGLVLSFFSALYYKYQQEIQIWLHAYKFCLCFVTEDSHKKYDAFISYSHSDEKFVTEHLVAELESGTQPYKICIHIRDWLVGEIIPTQIVNSVEDSRRTIVVLSSAYIESMWGQMEFRAAHRKSLRDGRSCVIVVIYGEIGDIENLDPELKTYLKMNTYVKWGDPWFWEKLKYAMPH